ncbi:(Na+)-NQR maturation NqrM [Sessilibacter sp. MAH2]
MTFLVTLLVLLTVVAAMSVGVIMGRKPITGSCGGIGAALGEKDYVCDFCGGDESKCEERKNGTVAKTDLAYEVKK